MYNTDLPTRAALPSTGQLLRSTTIAAVTAVALLITTVLPAEYGVDPTGIGHVLGLTQMGKIKMTLAAEAKAGKAAPAAQPSQAAAPPTAATAPTAPDAATPAPMPAKETASAQQHTTTVRLKPGQAAEIKLTMRKAATVRYEWTTQGGPVNFDTHGDPSNAPKGSYHGYGKGLNAVGDSGTLQAAFDGTHGWYWRNRSAAEVTVTLKTSGDYEQIKRVL